MHNQDSETALELRAQTVTDPWAMRWEAVSLALLVPTRKDWSY